MNKFKLYRFDSFVVYESYLTYQGLEYTNALRWKGLKQLEAIFKLAFARPSRNKVNTPVVFYSNKGEVFTVLVDDKFKFLNTSDILILLNFLEDRTLLWATVPDVLCVHRGSSMINSRFGQAVVINDEVCDATVEDLILKHRVEDSRQNEDGFNIRLEENEACVLKSTILASLQSHHPLRYFQVYDVKERSCLYARLGDDLLAYRANKYDLELDIDDEQKEYFMDALRGINCSNTSSVCSIEYRVIEEDNKFKFIVLLIVSLDAIKKDK